MSVVVWTPTTAVGEIIDEGGIVVVATLVLVILTAFWLTTWGTDEKIQQVKLPSGLTISIYGVRNRSHRS